MDDVGPQLTMSTWHNVNVARPWSVSKKIIEKACSWLANKYIVATPYQNPDPCQSPDFFKPGPDFFKPGPDFFKPGPDFFKPGPDFFKPGPDFLNKVRIFLNNFSWFKKMRTLIV